MPESFVGTIRAQRRIVIKHEVYDLLKLKEGDKVRIMVERVV